MSEATQPTPEPGRPTIPYDLLGGEAGLRRLVDAFYRVMDTAPEAAEIRAMHGEDLGPVAQSLFEWLSGWLGGPPLYSQRTGRVCLTGPHRPFAIGERERDQWLFCMRRAIDEVNVDDELKRMLDRPMFQIADMVRNR